MRLNIFGRRARHDFAENRETVEQMLARIDAMPVDPAYAHTVGPDDYPTAVYPRFALQQVEQRADGYAALVAVAGLKGGVR